MDNEKFETQLRDTLRQSEQNIDGPTLSKLRQARTSAIEKSKKPVIFQHPWLVSATTACAMVFAIVLLPRSIEPINNEVEPISLAHESYKQDVDLYENLAFYQWLATKESL